MNENPSRLAFLVERSLLAMRSNQSKTVGKAPTEGIRECQWNTHRAPDEHDGTAEGCILMEFTFKLL